MAASNINTVVDHREFDQGPGAALNARRNLGLQASSGCQQPPQGRSERRVGRQAQLLRRHRLGSAGRELRQLPLQGTPGGRRGAARLARVGAQDGIQAPGGGDHRQQRPVPRLARTTRAEAAATGSSPSRTCPPTPRTSRAPERSGGGAGRRHPLLAATRPPSSGAKGKARHAGRSTARPVSGRWAACSVTRDLMAKPCRRYHSRPSMARQHDSRHRPAGAGAAASAIADGRGSTRGSTSRRSTTRT